MNKLNRPQWEAVNARNTNVLVAASAGTGKTHAMINRVVEIIMGRVSLDYDVVGATEDKANRVPVNRILLMTYTKAAASEMKTRLNEALINELQHCYNDEDKRNYIMEQIDNVPVSDISTIHSFVAGILRNHYQEVGLSPLFDTADEQDEKAFQVDALTKTLDDLANDQILKRLKNIFSIKFNDKKLEDFIVRIYNYAYSQDDMNKWLDEVALSSYECDFEGSNAFDYYKNSIVNQAMDIIDYMISFRADAESENSLKLRDWLDEAIDKMSSWAKVKTLDEIISLCSLPIITTVGSPQAKGILKDLKATLKSKLENFYRRHNLIDMPNKDVINNEITAVGLMIKDIIHLVKAYSVNYNKVKSKANKLTFQDLEQYAVQLLSKDEVAKVISDKYDYILIDEYQDINYLQEYIITSISRGDNLFMVGDSKQSIYRFRQAVPEIFIDKQRRYSSGKEGFVTSFNHNFRSRKAILDYVNSVFAKAMTEDFGSINYRKAAMLITEPNDDTCYLSVNSFPPVSIYTYQATKAQSKEFTREVYSVRDHHIDQDEEINSSVIEADIIYNSINKLIGTQYYDKKIDNVRTIAYSDIAIIFRNRSASSKRIINALIDKNLPLNTSTFIKEDKSDEVKLIVNLLRLIDNFHQEIPLVAVMRSYLGKFSDDDIAKIRLTANDSKVRLYDILANVSDPQIKSKIVRLLNLINRYRIKSSYMSVFDLLREIIEETGYDRYILAHQEGQIMYKNIMAFLHSLKDKSFTISISRFLFHYDNYISSINASNSSESDMQSITVSTMHAVKGLEYPVVIIANSHSPFKSNNNNFIMDKEMGIAFQHYDIENRTRGKNIIYSIMAMKQDYKDREDNLNLFYVALTRAKNHLIIVGKENKEPFKCDLNAFEMKSFLEWAVIGIDRADYLCIEGDDLNANNDLSDEQKPERQIAYFSDKVNSTYKNIIQSMLKDDYKYKDSTTIGIKYSVSAINKSTDAEDIYVPSLFDEDSTFLGTASHKVMQHIDLKCNTIDDINEEINRMLELSLLTEEEADKIDKLEILNCIQSDIIQYAKDKNILREQSFMLKVRASEIMDISVQDEVLLQGAIDLIILGEENIIVDYKRSGKIQDEYFKNTYKRQLELYQMAAERILNIKINKKLIYLFGQNRVVEID